MFQIMQLRCKIARGLLLLSNGGSSATALCGYPIVKMEIRDSSQISTTAPIFLLSNYFSALNGTIASASFDLMMMVVVVMMVVAVMMLVVAETDGKTF